MKLFVRPDGAVQCLYAEAIDLAALGPTRIARASHVEPTPRGTWEIDLSPLGGGTLAGFKTRSEALKTEEQIVTEMLRQGAL